MKTHDEFLEDAKHLLLGLQAMDEADIKRAVAAIAGALRGAYTDGINQSIIEQTKRLHRGL